MINYALIIFAFLLGWFLHKKKDSILTIVRSCILFVKMNQKKDMQYNEFFEDYFHKDDYSKERNDDNV